MKLFHLLLAFSIFLCHTPVFAQPLPIAWQRSFGGSNHDGGNAVVKTGDGFIMVSTTYSADGDISGPANGSGDLWVTKISDNGIKIWDKNIGGTGLDVGQRIQQTADSGFIICGWTWSDNVPRYHASTDGWIVKLDKFGDVVWNKAYGGSGGEIFTSIAKTNDGGYIAVGPTGSFDGDVSAHLLGSGNDYWVVKIDDTGAIEWEHCYGGSSYETAYYVIQAKDNNFVVTGLTVSEDGDVTGHHGVMYTSDVWTIKINTSGGLIWQRCHGGTALEEGRSILEAKNGNFIIAGNTGSNNGDVSIFHGGDTTYGDAWVIMLNDTGAMVWEKTYGGSRNDGARCIIPTTDTGYVFVGWTLSNDGHVSGKKDSTDYWVVKINDTGAIEWQLCMGGANEDKANSICQISDNEYIVCGSTFSSDGDITENKGLTDTWVVKLGNDPVSIDLLKKESNFCIYPNPTTGKITLTFNDKFPEEEITISATNVHGQLCYKGKITNHSKAATSAEFDLSALPPGVYILKFNSSIYSFVSSIIIK